MAGKHHDGANNPCHNEVTSKAFCEARKFHGGDGITNPITGNPYTDPALEAAWDAGWTSRENGDPVGMCAE